MGLARIFGLCAALLFASSVSAAKIIDLGPSDYRSFGPNGTHTAQGVRSSFGQTVRMPPTLNTLNVTRNAVVPYGSIANGLRNITRVNPASVAASAAITGLFLAVDWVFDQSTGEWVREVENINEDPAFELWSVVQFSSNDAVRPYFPTPYAACEAYRQQRMPLYSYTSYKLDDTTSGRCTLTYPNGSVFQPNLTRRGNCPAGYQFQSGTGVCAGDPTTIDLSPEDWQVLGDALPSLPAQQVADAAGFTQRQIGSPLPGYQDITMTGPSSVSGPSSTSTSTDPATGDTTVTTSSTQTELSYGDTTITATDTTTSTTYQNGQETGTTVTTETPGELPVSTGGGSAGDWPRFCDWATVVCDWLNWTQEDPPPEEDLPVVVDDDFYEEKRISFGSKSCPPPHEVNLAPFLETTVGVSFQPLCDFAGLIYYMVMAASYIIAAYISIGVARA